MPFRLGPFPRFVTFLLDTKPKLFKLFCPGRLGPFWRYQRIVDQFHLKKILAWVHFAWMLGLELFANHWVFRMKPLKRSIFSRASQMSQASELRSSEFESNQVLKTKFGETPENLFHLSNLQEPPKAGAEGGLILFQV